MLHVLGLTLVISFLPCFDPQIMFNDVLEFSKIENSNLNFIYKNYSKLIPLIGEIIVGDRKPYDYLINSINKFSIMCSC